MFNVCLCRAYTKTGLSVIDAKVSFQLKLDKGSQVWNKHIALLRKF